MVDDDNTSWYGVRCLFQHGPFDPDATSYEGRITIWQAGSFDEAIALAETEAAEYVADLAGVTDLGLVQAFSLQDLPNHGAEVFSLIRDSALAPDDYLDHFFDTGGERQQSAG